MLSDTDVEKIMEGVAQKKGYNISVIARSQTQERIIKISGGVHEPFEFAMQADATADDVRREAEKIFSVAP